MTELVPEHIGHPLCTGLEAIHTLVHRHAWRPRPPPPSGAAMTGEVIGDMTGDVISDANCPDGASRAAEPRPAARQRRRRRRRRRDLVSDSDRTFKWTEEVEPERTEETTQNDALLLRSTFVCTVVEQQR